MSLEQEKDRNSTRDYLDHTRKEIILPGHWYNLALMTDYEALLDFYNWFRRYHTHVLLYKVNHWENTVITFIGVYDNLNKLASRIEEEIRLDSNNIRKDRVLDYTATSFGERLVITDTLNKPESSPSFHCLFIDFNETRPGIYTDGLAYKNQNKL